LKGEFSGKAIWESEFVSEDVGSGETEVDVGLMTCVIKSGMVDGVTLSIVMNAGSKIQRVADSSSKSECGIGILEAESISLC
jgi:hypothetical protein